MALQEPGVVRFIRQPAAPALTGWLTRTRGRYFNTWANGITTVACAAFIVWVAAGLIDWALLDAIWRGDGEVCKVAEGACWPFVMTKLRFMIFGYYPFEAHWRPGLAVALFLALCAVTMWPRAWSRGLLVAWAVGLAVMYLLMAGGVPGLPAVPTSQWGGLPLTIMLSFIGLAAAFPLGVGLALARRSKLPAIRTLSIVYIEAVRGVPLISILFMASVMLPLFLPTGYTIDKVLRAQVAIILFAAAYVAEVVRGGLQGVEKGQYEAGAALGLGYWPTMRLIVLPQALKIVIPPMVTTFIGFFQDTTLVAIVGLFDFLGTVRAAMRDPSWQGIAVAEAYLFAAAVYFAFCYGMATYSRYLERRLAREHR